MSRENTLRITEMTDMPKDFVRALIPKFDFRWDIIRHHIIPMMIVLFIVMGFYYAARFIAPGWITYTISTVALIAIALTALARLNDIPHTNTDARWQVRRGGLILVIMGCSSLVVWPLISWTNNVQPDFPPWREVIIRIGILAVWVTTPMMPPWHRYISGEFRKVRVEVPVDVQVDIVRTETTPGGAMFTEHDEERGP